MSLTIDSLLESRKPIDPSVASNADKMAEYFFEFRPENLSVVAESFQKAKDSSSTDQTIVVADLTVEVDEHSKTLNFDKQSVVAEAFASAADYFQNFAAFGKLALKFDSDFHNYQTSSKHYTISFDTTFLKAYRVHSSLHLLLHKHLMLLQIHDHSSWNAWSKMWTIYHHWRHWITKWWWLSRATHTVDWMHAMWKIHLILQKLLIILINC